MGVRAIGSRLLIAAVTVSGLVTSGAGAASATPDSVPTGAPRFLHYVALGDSYTSGPFIPLIRVDPLGCARSTNDYPAILARAIKPVVFTDVSCGGADTTHMTAPQSVPLGFNPPQFDALRPDTDLVTIGIGGNDYSVFGDLVGTCPGLRASDPTGSPCQEHFTVDGADTLKVAIESTGANVGVVLDGIHQRSPRAEVLVIGYPRIVPPSGYCPDILPFADGDYGWLDSVEQALNDAVESAAAAHDATYVDMYTPSLGHDACADSGAAWINGKDFKLFEAAPYHPYRNYMDAAASIIGKQLPSLPMPPLSSAASVDVAPGGTATDEQVQQLADLWAFPPA